MEGVATVNLAAKMERVKHYLQDHEIFGLFEELTTALIYHLPDDPKAFLVAAVETLRDAELDPSGRRVDLRTALRGSDFDLPREMMRPGVNRGMAGREQMAKRRPQSAKGTLERGGGRSTRAHDPVPRYGGNDDLAGQVSVARPGSRPSSAGRLGPSPRGDGYAQQAQQHQQHQQYQQQQQQPARHDYQGAQIGQHHGSSSMAAGGRQGAKPEEIGFTLRRGGAKSQRGQMPPGQGSPARPPSAAGRQGGPTRPVRVHKSRPRRGAAMEREDLAGELIDAKQVLSNARKDPYDAAAETPGAVPDTVNTAAARIEAAAEAEAIAQVIASANRAVAVSGAPATTDRQALEQGIQQQQQQQLQDDLDGVESSSRSRAVPATTAMTPVMATSSSASALTAAKAGGAAGGITSSMLPPAASPVGASPSPHATAGGSHYRRPASPTYAEEMADEDMDELAAEVELDRGRRVAPLPQDDDGGSAAATEAESAPSGAKPKIPGMRDKLLGGIRKVKALNRAGVSLWKAAEAGQQTRLLIEQELSDVSGRSFRKVIDDDGGDSSGWTHNNNNNNKQGEGNVLEEIARVEREVAELTAMADMAREQRAREAAVAAAAKKRAAAGGGPNADEADGTGDGVGSGAVAPSSVQSSSSSTASSSSAPATGTSTVNAAGTASLAAAAAAATTTATSASAAVPEVRRAQDEEDTDAEAEVDEDENEINAEIGGAPRQRSLAAARRGGRPRAVIPWGRAAPVPPPLPGSPAGANAAVVDASLGSDDEYGPLDTEGYDPRRHGVPAIRGAANLGGGGGGGPQGHAAMAAEVDSIVDGRAPADDPRRDPLGGKAIGDGAIVPLAIVLDRAAPLADAYDRSPAAIKALFRELDRDRHGAAPLAAFLVSLQRNAGVLGFPEDAVLALDGWSALHALAAEAIAAVGPVTVVISAGANAKRTGTAATMGSVASSAAAAGVSSADSKTNGVQTAPVTLDEVASLLTLLSHEVRHRRLGAVTGAYRSNPSAFRTAFERLSGATRPPRPVPCLTLLSDPSVSGTLESVLGPEAASRTSAAIGRSRAAREGQSQTLQSQQSHHSGSSIAGAATTTATTNDGAGGGHFADPVPVVLNDWAEFESLMLALDAEVTAHRRDALAWSFFYGPSAQITQPSAQGSAPARPTDGRAPFRRLFERLETGGSSSTSSSGSAMAQSSPARGGASLSELSNALVRMSEMLGLVPDDVAAFVRDGFTAGGWDADGDGTITFAEFEIAMTELLRRGDAERDARLAEAFAERPSRFKRLFDFLERDAAGSVAALDVVDAVSRNAASLGLPPRDAGRIERCPSMVEMVRRSLVAPPPQLQPDTGRLSRPTSARGGPSAMYGPTTASVVAGAAGGASGGAGAGALPVGRVAWSDFARAMEDAAASAAALRASTLAAAVESRRAEFRSLFDALDANGDGTVSLLELTRGFARLQGALGITGLFPRVAPSTAPPVQTQGGGAPGVQSSARTNPGIGTLADLFRAMDADGSGSVTFAEFEAYLSSVASAVKQERRERVAALFASSKHNEETWQRVFRSLDLDGNGVVTLRELRRALKSDPGLFSVLIGEKDIAEADVTGIAAASATARSQRGSARSSRRDTASASIEASTSARSASSTSAREAMEALEELLFPESKFPQPPGGFTSTGGGRGGRGQRNRMRGPLGHGQQLQVQPPPDDAGVTWDEFRALMIEGAESARISRESALAEAFLAQEHRCRAAFERFDTDGSGTVTAEEFKRGLEDRRLGAEFREILGSDAVRSLCAMDWFDRMTQAQAAAAEAASLQASRSGSGPNSIPIAEAASSGSRSVGITFDDFKGVLLSAAAEAKHHRSAQLAMGLDYYEAELHDLFTAMDTDGSGELSGLEFARGIERHPAITRMLGADGVRAIRELPIFTGNSGSNKNGHGEAASITWETFISSIRAAQAAAQDERRALLADALLQSREQLQQLFSRLDRNGDGKVSRTELELGVRNQRDLVRILGPGGASAVLGSSQNSASVPPPSRTGSGSLGGAGGQQLQQQQQQQLSFFAAADADGDGSITWEEFEAAVAQIADAAAADRIRRMRSAFRKAPEKFRALYERLVREPAPKGRKKGSQVPPADLTRPVHRKAYMSILRNQAELVGVSASDVEAVQDMDWWIDAPPSGLVVWDSIKHDFAARGPQAATSETGRDAKGRKVMVAQPGGIRKRSDVDRLRR